jgi:hypothetical protein
MTQTTVTLDNIGQVCTFNVYPAGIIQTPFNRVTINAILDAATAKDFIDPVALHKRVYPTLPAGTPNLYNGYSYLKITLPNGTVTAVGVPWIDWSSFVVNANIACTIQLQDIVNSDLEKLKVVLLANGFNTFQIIPT